MILNNLDLLTEILNFECGLSLGIFDWSWSVGVGIFFHFSDNFKEPLYIDAISYKKPEIFQI
jgi:hypothetical protein